MTRGFPPLIFCLFLILLSGCDQISGRISANKGYQAYIDRKFDEAALEYEEAYLSMPNNNTILRNLGYSYLASAHEDTDKEKSKVKMDKAIVHMTKLLGKLPNDTELQALLVDAWELGNQLDKAAAYFQERITKNPKDVEALRTLAVINLKRGNYPAAIELYQKRKAITPDDMRVGMAIALTCWQYLRAGGPMDSAQAVAIGTTGYEAAMEVSAKEPKNFTALVYAGLILRERARRQTNPLEGEKDVKLADEIYKKVQALNPAKGGR